MWCWGHPWWKQREFAKEMLCDLPNWFACSEARMLGRNCWFVLLERCHFQELRGSQVFAVTNAAGQIPALNRPRLEISNEFFGPKNPTKLWKIAILLADHPNQQVAQWVPRKQPECKYNPFRMLPAAEEVLQKALHGDGENHNLRIGQSPVWNR